MVLSATAASEEFSGRITALVSRHYHEADQDFLALLQIRQEQAFKLAATVRIVLENGFAAVTQVHHG